MAMRCTIRRRIGHSTRSRHADSRIRFGTPFSSSNTPHVVDALYAEVFDAVSAVSHACSTYCTCGGSFWRHHLNHVPSMIPPESTTGFCWYSDDHMRAVVDDRFLIFSRFSRLNCDSQRASPGSRPI